MYGGSTTAILINTPGEAASVMTTIDGYEMAKNGRAGAALAVSAIGSFIAGTLGVVALTLFARAARVDGAQVRPGRVLHADAVRHDRGRLARRQVAGQGHDRRPCSG